MTGISGAQIASKILFLGTSMKVFLVEICTEIAKLSKGDRPHYKEDHHLIHSGPE